MEAPNLGPQWFWNLLIILAVIGIIMVIFKVITWIIWLFNHVTIN